MAFQAIRVLRKKATSLQKGLFMKDGIASRRNSGRNVLIGLVMMMVATAIYMSICLHNPYHNSVADIRDFRNRLGPGILEFHDADFKIPSPDAWAQFNQMLSTQIEMPGFGMQVLNDSNVLQDHDIIHIADLPLYLAKYKKGQNPTVTFVITPFAKRHFPKIEKRMIRSQLVYPLAIERKSGEIFADFEPSLTKIAPHEYLPLSAIHFHNDFVLFALGEGLTHADLVEAALEFTSLRGSEQKLHNVF